MRAFVVSLMILTSIYAQDSQSMTVQKTQEFVGTISPDKLSTTVVLNIVEQDYTQASNTLYSLSDNLKKYESICKNSGYAINKAFEWDNTKRKNMFIGYKGTLNIQCKYDKPSQIEKFYNDPLIKKLIANNKSVSASNLGTKWIVSKKALDKKRSELEVRAILYSHKFAKRLSKLVKRRCIVKSMDLSAPKQNITPVLKQEMFLSRGLSANSIKSLIPSKQDATVNYVASYSFVCE